MPAPRPAQGRDVPAELRAEVEQIARRAAAAGRPLDPMPALELATRPRHGSRVFLGPPDGSQLPRVRLGLDLLDVDPADRAWAIAHELAHVLRRQEGIRLEFTGRRVTAGALLGVLAVAAVLTAGYGALFGSGRYVALLLTLGLVGATGMWLVLVALIRQEETETDATATDVFGEVLTPAGVERIQRNEGRLSRYVPTVLRTHPHPAARRRAGLATTPAGSHPAPTPPPFRH
jgi:Zn-dependent protease with chaperone function